MTLSVRLAKLAFKAVFWVPVLVLAAWLALGWARFVQLTVTRWPEISYERRNPSTARECNQVRSGMDMDRVLSVIDQDAPPPEERLDGDRFTFWRKDHACVVELDAVTKRVAKAHVDDSPRGTFARWPAWT